MEVLFTAFPGIIEDNLDFISYRTVPTTAIYLLGAVLRKGGVKVRILDPSVIVSEIEKSSFGQVLVKHLQGINVICISANTINWGVTTKAIKFIREMYGTSIKIIIGGLHPTYFYRHIIQKYDVDFIMLGEGENTICDLINAIENEKEVNRIPGVISKSTQNLSQIAVPTISSEDFNKLPLPIFEDMPVKTYYSLPIETSRGCKFGCAFCSIAYKNDWRAFDEVLFPISYSRLKYIFACFIYAK